MDINNLTDEQILQLVSRIQDVMGHQPVSDALAPELKEAEDKGIINGGAPYAFATRAQAAVMTLRAVKALDE